MAFRDFTFPMVLKQLGLRLEDRDLLSTSQPYPVRLEFAEFLDDGTLLALANSTEKAKSEFIIAPVLLELKRSMRWSFTLFSGVEWDVDRDRGLKGYCGFILGHGLSQHVLQAPCCAIVTAKRDLIRTGLGQCIATMMAAGISNERAGNPIAAI